MKSENQIAFEIADKGYYDYDFTRITENKISTGPKDTTIWSHEKLASIFSKIKDPKTGALIFDKDNDTSSELTRAERIQREIRRDKGLE
ncbi:MAG: hypothetical protein HDS14_00515 [Bacteroides sp.]|nr:hypothetical protein [Bacteroides sp.]